MNDNDSLLQSVRDKFGTNGQITLSPDKAQRVIGVLGVAVELNLHAVSPSQPVTIRPSQALREMMR